MVGINKFFDLHNRQCFVCGENLRDNASVIFEHKGEIKFFCKDVDCRQKASRLWKGEITYVIPTERDKKIRTVSSIK